MFPCSALQFLRLFCAYTFEQLYLRRNILCESFSHFPRPPQFYLKDNVVFTQTSSVTFSPNKKLSDLYFFSGVSIIFFFFCSTRCHCGALIPRRRAHQSLLLMHLFEKTFVYNHNDPRRLQQQTCFHFALFIFDVP